MIWILALTPLFLGFVNGANDTFKGVATLYGGRVLSYRRALMWAALSTLIGASCSVFLSARLLELFSGGGLIAPSVLAEPGFLFSVALGAALVVMIATVAGLPVSTTHGIVGALFGAGLASGGLVSGGPFLKLVFLPLILGPVLAIAATSVIYPLLHRVRVGAGIETNTCLCVQERDPVVAGPGVAAQSTGVNLVVADERTCRSSNAGTVAGVSLESTMNRAHILSAGALGFARGLNDTPKMAAILLAVMPFFPRLGILSMAAVMTAGGLLFSRKVAQKMSLEITGMNPGQAFTANSVTALLVILGSVAGLPLSTTHVSCGSLFGIGMSGGTARARTIAQIVLAWVTTLPLAALFSAAVWYAVKALG